MRIAVISDIHGNLQAAEAVLELIEKLDVSRIVCLGDLVGYGGDPSACIELARRFCSRFTVLGNHDAGAVELTSIDYFNPAAQASIFWTRDVLNSSEKEYLRNLQYVLDLDICRFVHSTPDDPSGWKYLLFEEDASPLFTHFDNSILFYGHTHVPAVFRLDKKGNVSESEASNFVLDPKSRYIVNVGSVGQPRDGDPRTSFVIFDSERAEVNFFREPYDIDSARKSILDKGLPKILADRLTIGR